MVVWPSCLIYVACEHALLFVWCFFFLIIPNKFSVCGSGMVLDSLFIFHTSSPVFLFLIRCDKASSRPVCSDRRWAGTGAAAVSLSKVSFLYLFLWFGISFCSGSCPDTPTLSLRSDAICWSWIWFQSRIILPLVSFLLKCCLYMPPLTQDLHNPR